MHPIVDDDFENITIESIPITLSEGWNMDDNEVVYGMKEDCIWKSTLHETF